MIFSLALSSVMILRSSTMAMSRFSSEAMPVSLAKSSSPFLLRVKLTSLASVWELVARWESMMSAPSTATRLSRSTHLLIFSSPALAFTTGCPARRATRSLSISGSSSNSGGIAPLKEARASSLELK